MEAAEEQFPEDLAGQEVLAHLDAGLTPLQAVQEWAAEGNPPAQRVAYILSMPAAAEASSLDECRAVLVSLLTQLVFDDHPDIKEATARVLGDLGLRMASKDPYVTEAGGSIDAMDLLVLSHRLLQDPERGVQEAAATSVAMIAPLLTRENQHDHLTAVIDALMHNYDDEQMQECAVELLTKIVASLGPTHPGWCEECALPRLLKLAMHRDYGIRVATVAGLVQLAACLPEEERTGQLLGAFADLCNDQVWSVRQDCASDLTSLAQHLPREAVRERLLPLWEQLAGDVSAWVQAAARRQAGPLLASIHPEDCSQALLESFVGSAAGPAPLASACAHFLPAVLHNLGAQRWPQLKESLTALAGSEYVSVRVALAESAHELAAMLEPEAVVADLVPALERLSVDDELAVADALAAHLRELLHALPPGPARLAQLSFLHRMHPEDGSSCGQWRMRLLVAQQLADVAALLSQQGLAEVLLPATLRLCEDPVAAVREAAAQQLGAMVARLLPAAVVPSGTGSPGGSPGGSEQGQQQQQQQQEQQDVEGPALEQRQQQPEAGEAEQEQQAAAGPLPQQQAGSEEQGAKGIGVAETQQDAAPAAAATAAAGHEERQEAAHDQQAQVQQRQEEVAGDPAAVVQQIVQHMVELQRSSCHRARQTYLAFCAALLLPPAQQEQEQGKQAEGAAAASAAAGEAPEGAVQPAAMEAQAAALDAPAAALPLQQQQQQQQVSEAVAGSSIMQGLLEGAVALAADPVPNVRMGVARLLAALRQKQPQLVAANTKVAGALDALANDADRDVRQAASS